MLKKILIVIGVIVVVFVGGRRRATPMSVIAVRSWNAAIGWRRNVLIRT